MFRAASARNRRTRCDSRFRRWALLYFYAFYFFIVIITFSLLASRRRRPAHPPALSPPAQLQISFVMDAFFLHYQKGSGSPGASSSVASSQRNRTEHELSFSIVFVRSMLFRFFAAPLTLTPQVFDRAQQGQRGLVSPASCQPTLPACLLPLICASQLSQRCSFISVAFKSRVCFRRLYSRTSGKTLMTQ